MALSEPEEQPRGSELSQILGDTASGANSSVPDKKYEEDPEALKRRLMSMARAAVTHANNSDLGKRRAAMARSNEAYRSIHYAKSKYNHKAYSSRSKLFIPKTMAAVRSKVMAVRTALFGNEQAISITPQDDTNPEQAASAELNKALINYRFNTAVSKKSGIPWIMLACGAAHDACVAGIAVSKTYWEFEEKEEEVEEGFDPYDMTLDPFNLGPNGRPTRKTVIRDRPMILPIEPENVIVDMAAPWWDVIQEGQYLIVKHPMSVGEVKHMMTPGAQHMGGGPWYPIEDKVMAAAVEDTTAAGVRTAREGQDRYGRMAQPSVNDFDIVWVHENFIKVEGCDYHFWSLGTKQLLSDPGKVGEEGHYPAHHGERPYVMGVGRIEPHVALPMSHVESWAALQEELNETANLRLDTMKQAIAPIAVYRLGANIDFRQVRERGPDAIIGVSDLQRDLDFKSVPGPPPTIFAEADRLNNQFDELAGAFASSTVQSSRAVGETARGMQLVSSAANSVQEFDLAIFLETWAEPVIRHLVWLEQYYETDQHLLTILARKANLYQRFGIDTTLDDILERQLTVKVNVGPGAGDPITKLQRINAAVDMSLKVAPALMGQATPVAENLMEEIWASTGVSAQRVFKFISPEEAEQKAAEMAASQPNPDTMKVEAEKQKMEIEAQKGQMDLELQREKMGMEREKMDMDRENQRGKMDIEREKMGLRSQKVEHQSQLDQQKMEHQAVAQQREMEMQEQMQQHNMEMAAQDAALRQQEFERTGMMQDQQFQRDSAMQDQQFAIEQEQARHKMATGDQQMRLNTLDRAMKMPNPQAQQDQSNINQRLATIENELQQLTAMLSQLIPQTRQHNPAEEHQIGNNG